MVGDEIPPYECSELSGGLSPPLKVSHQELCDISGDKLVPPSKNIYGFYLRVLLV